MSTTIVGVCNSALIKCGADRISTITESTRSAVLLNAIFNFVRDDVLRAHPWKFALRRVELAPSATTPEFGYAYQYVLPSDLLRLLETDPDDIDYVVETDLASGDKVILTDEPTLQVRYIWRQDDPTQWDSNFAEAFAWRLAREVAYALTQSSALVQTCDQQYRAVLAEARSMSSSEAPLRALEADLWTSKRR